MPGKLDPIFVLAVPFRGEWGPGKPDSHFDSVVPCMDQNAGSNAHVRQCFLFQNEMIFFFGYFDPDFSFLDNKK